MCVPDPVSLGGYVCVCMLPENRHVRCTTTDLWINKPQCIHLCTIIQWCESKELYQLPNCMKQSILFAAKLILEMYLIICKYSNTYLLTNTPSTTVFSKCKSFGVTYSMSIDPTLNLKADDKQYLLCNGHSCPPYYFLPCARY